MSLKKSFIILALLWVSSNIFAYTPKQYIATYKNVAISEMKRTHIPASIILAQAMLWSDNGNNKLAKLANNHFSLKSTLEWEGEIYEQKVQDPRKKNNIIKTYYKAFGSVEASYREHSNFLKDKNNLLRFGFLFEYATNDYQSWAKGLKQAKYSKDRLYRKKLISLIEEYHLYKYDLVIPPSRKILVRRKANFIKEQEMSSSPVPEPKTFIQYGLKYVKSFEGDTPYTIADRHNIHVDRLLNYNRGYTADEPLAKGTTIYLVEKNAYNKGRQLYHIVKEGETMFSISQKYGIRLSVLYKKNNIPLDAIPLIGEKLSLKKPILKTPLFKKL